jgi:Glycosyl transferase family 11
MTLSFIKKARFLFHTKKLAPLPSSERPVFWAGSGGCGFLRTNDLLAHNNQSSIFFKDTAKLQNHGPIATDSDLVWERGDNETERIQSYFRKHGVYDHHIASYTLRYAPEIIEHFKENALFLCLQSAKSVDSLWVQWGYRNPLVADRTRKNRFPVQLFPDLTGAASGKLATQQYYDTYYKLAGEYATAYPNNFCIVDADRFFTDEAYFTSIVRRFNLSLTFKEYVLACDETTVTTSLHGGIGNNFFQMAEPVAFCAEHNLLPPQFATWNMSDFPSQYRNAHFIDGHTGTPEELRHAFPHIKWLPPSRASFDYKFMLNDMFAFADVHHQRKTILDYFQPSQEVQEYIRRKYPRIQEQRTISLHYRVGGLNADTHAFSPITTDWYKQIFASYFPEQYDCFVFSDNLGEAKHLIKALEKCTKNTYHLVDENVFNTVIMMSMCKNHILSNSTLSFWGAYLDPHQPNGGTTILHKNFTSYHSEPHIECRMIPYPEWKII